jgi:hypothetical protein
MRKSVLNRLGSRTTYVRNVQRLRTNVCLEIIELLLLFVFDIRKMVSPEWNLLHLQHRLVLIPTRDIATLEPLAVCIIQYAAHELVVLSGYMRWDRVLGFEM